MILDFLVVSANNQIIELMTMGLDPLSYLDLNLIDINCPRLSRAVETHQRSRPVGTKRGEFFKFHFIDWMN